MKTRFASLALAAVLIAAVPAVAGDLYDNGPVNGTQDAWPINFGMSVSNSIQVNGTVQGFSFWAWLFPGDTLQSVQLSIGTTPFGQDIFNGVLTNLTPSQCFSNPFGDFNVCDETATFSGPALNGNYWLTLQNASVASGDPVYWDENSGIGCTSPGCPSLAQANNVGTIPSESFTIMGSAGTTTAGTGSTPEPSSLVLWGSGALGVIGMLRRGFRR